MSNIEALVREASYYKFKAQGDAYFPRMYVPALSIDQLKAEHSILVEGTFLMVIGKVPDHPRIMLAGFRLVECIVFEGVWFYLTVIRDWSGTVDIFLTPPTIPPDTEVKGISLSLICTGNQTYVDFLQWSIAHYQEVLEGFDHEINVAYFGDGGNGNRVVDGVNVRRYPGDMFHMAYARNRSLEMCTKSHVLMIDLDCYLSADQLTSLIGSIPQTNGVINFCRPVHPFQGNGLIFGRRDKLLANMHHEGFQKFYFEDTEHLMNLSRIGIVPWCYFMDFDFVADHPRGTTRGYFPHNQKMFETILKCGYRV